MPLAAGSRRRAQRCPSPTGYRFPGSSFSRKWHLADAPLRTELPADQAHVFFFDGGAFLFMIRMVNQALKDRQGERVWRVMGNRPEPLSQLVLAEQAGYHLDFEFPHLPPGLRNPGGRERLLRGGCGPHPLANRCAGHEPRPGGRMGFRTTREREPIAGVRPVSGTRSIGGWCAR